MKPPIESGKHKYRSKDYSRISPGKNSWIKNSEAALSITGYKVVDFVCHIKLAYTIRASYAQLKII